MPWEFITIINLHEEPKLWRSRQNVKKNLLKRKLNVRLNVKLGPFASRFAVLSS